MSTPLTPALFPYQLSRQAKVYVWLAGVFLVALILANLLGGLLTPLTLPWGTQVVTAGIFIFPITFLLTDLLNEYYGVEGVRLVTLLGLGMSILTYGIFTLAEQMTVLPNSPLPQAAFMQVSSQYTGLVLASLIVYLIGQTLDIVLFVWIRRWTGGRLLWLRATGSTLISQLVDSFLIVLLAFSKDLSVGEIVAIGWANYQVKVLVAVLITPLLYLGHAGIRRLLGIPLPQKALEVITS